MLDCHHANVYTQGMGDGVHALPLRPKLRCFLLLFLSHLVLLSPLSGAHRSLQVLRHAKLSLHLGLLSSLFFPAVEFMELVPVAGAHLEGLLFL